MNDLKFASRQLLKNPGFTAVAVLTLALGIGATTAIVSVLNIAVLDPLPVRDSDRLVQLGSTHQQRGWSPGINPLALRGARQQINLFARVVVAYDWDALTLSGDDFPQLVRGMRVTSEFFSLWNLRPLLGRTFAVDEGQLGKDGVLVISHRLWQNQFGGDQAIIGRTIPFRERPMTVVGVMPAHFSFPKDITPKFLVVRTSIDPVVLYKPIGQALKSAGADLRMPEFYNLDEALRTRMAGHRAVMLYLSIFSAVGLFLASIGLYGVLVYSVARRTREIGIRMALGAQIADVMRLILRQGLMLVAIGGVIGITITAAAARVLRAYLFGVSSTDPLTFIATALLLAAVALLACWLPARRAGRIHPIEALRCE